MEVKCTKKSFYLPDPLYDFFRVWCKPGRNYSPKAAGAILFYMALSPDTRDQCEKAAHRGDIEQLVGAIKSEVEKQNWEAQARAAFSSALVALDGPKQKRQGKSAKSG